MAGSATNSPAAHKTPIGTQTGSKPAALPQSAQAGKSVGAVRRGPVRPLTWSISDTQGHWYIYAPHWRSVTAGLLVCVERSFVKRTTAYSWQLPEWEKREVAAGQELRIEGEPSDVESEYEKARHEWTHLHKRIRLGPMEVCKAELVEARKRLNRAEKKSAQERDHAAALGAAQQTLLQARARLGRELDERRRLGLSMEIDPFDASFETGPMGEDSAGTNGFALVGVDPGRGLDASGPVVPPLPPLSALAAGADADAESKSGADARITQCCIRAYGTVQGAMFRQTVIRGAKKRGLRAGATNSAPGEGGEPSVTVTLEGKSKGVSQIVNVLRQSRPLNDWGAVAERIVDLEGKDYVAIEQHEVTTENVDNFDWNPSCQMYL